MSSFYVHGNLTHFLFKEWNAFTAGDIFLACLAMGLCALLLELAKTVRLNVTHLQRRKPLFRSVVQSERTPLLGSSLVTSSTVSKEREQRIKLHIGDSMLYILQVVAGYFLMLAVMSFNGWIFIAVLIASALGYFLFGLFRHDWMMGMRYNITLSAENSPTQELSGSTSTRSHYS